MGELRRKGAREQIDSVTEHDVLHLAAIAHRLGENPGELPSRPEPGAAHRDDIVRPLDFNGKPGGGADPLCDGDTAGQRDPGRQRRAANDRGDVESRAWRREPRATQPSATCGLRAGHENGAFRLATFRRAHGEIVGGSHFVVVLES